MRGKRYHAFVIEFSAIVTFREGLGNAMLQSEALPVTVATSWILPASSALSKSQWSLDVQWARDRAAAGMG